MEEDLCLIVVDGGCRLQGTPQASSYGSAEFTTCNWKETVRWESLPAAFTAPEAEYDALIAALEFCREAFAHREVFPRLLIQMDAVLVIQQVRGSWGTRAENLKPRRICVLQLLEAFPEWEFEYLHEREVKKILGH